MMRNYTFNVFYEWIFRQFFVCTQESIMQVFILKVTFNRYQLAALNLVQALLMSTLPTDEVRMRTPIRMQGGSIRFTPRRYVFYMFFSSSSMKWAYSQYDHHFFTFDSVYIHFFMVSLFYSTKRLNTVTDLRRFISSNFLLLTEPHFTLFTSKQAALSSNCDLQNIIFAGRKHILKLYTRNNIRDITYFVETYNFNTYYEILPRLYWHVYIIWQEV